MKGNTLMKWRMRSNPAARYGSGIFFFSSTKYSYLSVSTTSSILGQFPR